MSEVHDITINKLPYQDHPFVHGVRDGKDVWLMSNGQWTDIDGHPDAHVQFNPEWLSRDLLALRAAVRELSDTIFQDPHLNASQIFKLVTKIMADHGIEVDNG